MALLSATIEIIFLGVLKFGIWGAALATCLGTITCVLIGFTPFFRGKLQLHFCKPKFSVPMVKQIIVCGTPNFLNNISGRIVTALMNVLLLRIGGAVAVSVYGILMSIEMMVSSLLYGLCDSLQPAVGYNWGAGKYNRVTSFEKCCFGAGAFISVFMAIIIFCFPQQLTLIFMKDAGRDLLEMAIPAVKLFSLTFLVRWISYATQSFLLAIEKTKPASILSVRATA